MKSDIHRVREYHRNFIVWIIYARKLSLNGQNRKYIEGVVQGCSVKNMF